MVSRSLSEEEFSVDAVVRAKENILEECEAHDYLSNLLL